MRLRFELAALLFVALTVSSAHAAALPAGCGDDAVQFKVKTEKGAPIPAAEAGKAQLVFIQTTHGDEAGSPLSRFGVDGEWVGAARGKSYIVVSVAPGAHKVCASRQSGAQVEKTNVGAASVNAAAGKTYYFEFVITTSAVSAAAMQGGARLPGQYPGSMDAKRHDTLDTAELMAVDGEDGSLSAERKQRSISTQK